MRLLMWHPCRNLDIPFVTKSFFRICSMPKFQNLCLGSMVDRHGCRFHSVVVFINCEISRTC